MAEQPETCFACGDFLGEDAKRGVCSICRKRGFQHLGAGFPFTHENWTARAIVDHCLTVFWRRAWAWILSLCLLVLIWAAMIGSLSVARSSSAIADLLALVLMGSGVASLSAVIHYLSMIGHHVCGLDYRIPGPGVLAVQLLCYVIVVGGISWVLLCATLFVVLFMLGPFYLAGVVTATDYDNISVTILSFMSFFIFQFVFHLSLEWAVGFEGEVGSSSVSFKHVFITYKNHFIMIHVSQLACLLLAASGVLIGGIGLFVTLPLALSLYFCLYLALRTRYLRAAESV